jgi:hypothetical protein
MMIFPPSAEGAEDSPAAGRHRSETLTHPAETGGKRGRGDRREGGTEEKNSFGLDCRGPGAYR